MFPNTPRPPPGLVLAQLRGALGYRRQGDLAAMSRVVALRLGEDRVSSISQASLSKLEAGQITEARDRTLRLLGVILGLNAADFAFHFGVPCPSVPLLDGSPGDAGKKITAFRLDAGLSVDQVRNAMAAAGGAVKRHVYLAVEAGVAELAAQPEEVRVALEHALGLPPELWTVMTGLRSADTGQLPPSGLSVPGDVLGRWRLYLSNGELPPNTTLPLIPIEQLYPPTLPSADNIPERVAVHKEAVMRGLVQPGVLLTNMPDSALLPPGPQKGDLLLVDTLVDDVQAGTLYVIQAGDRPLVVRRAVLDGLNQFWFLPDALDFQQFWPVLARDARVIGEVLHTWPQPGH